MNPEECQKLSEVPVLQRFAQAMQQMNDTIRKAREAEMERRAAFLKAVREGRVRNES